MKEGFCLIIVTQIMTCSASSEPSCVILGACWQRRMQDFGQEESVIRFSSLSGLNPLTNQVLDKNIKIIFFIY
jgi:hypothetical protein